MSFDFEELYIPEDNKSSPMLAGSLVTKAWRVLQTFKRGHGSGGISSINDLSERKWILERYDGMVWIGYGSG
jgi:hypothetical protein